jgi:hypothetical protein
LTAVDPNVSRVKFDREVERLVAQQTTLQAKGIFLVGRPTYPIVDLVFVPRRPLSIVMNMQKSGRLFLPGGYAVTAEFLNLAARAFKARFDLTDYDLQAPSLVFLDPWTDKELAFDQMFRALEYEKERKQHVVLLADHPVTHKPFICVRGIREYHIHPQHSGDDWLLYRGDFSLFSIVLSVWRVTVDITFPVLMPQPNGWQVNWQADEKL